MPSAFGVRRDQTQEGLALVLNVASIGGDERRSELTQLRWLDIVARDVPSVGYVRAGTGVEDYFHSNVPLYF